MKKQFLPIILTLAFTANSASCPIPKPFKLLNDQEAKLFQKTSITLVETEKSQLPALINLWATWCAPCRKELPFLQDLYQAEISEITLVNIEDDPVEAEKVLSDLKIKQLRTDYAQMELLDTLKINALPSSILFYNEKVYLGTGMLKKEEDIKNWLNCLSNNNRS